MQNPLETFSFTDPFSSWWPFIFAIIVGIVVAIRSQIAGPTCPSESSLSGKVVVLTGCSRGIGLEVLVELLKRGATVYLATRDLSRTREIIKCQRNLKRITLNDKIKIMELDLSSLASVERFAGNIGAIPVDILINNAGTAHQPFELTEDGIELHFAVNFLAPFLLTHLLKPKMSLEGARVIFLGADLHREADILPGIFQTTAEDYSSRKAYASSKLALVLISRYLATQWQASNVTVNVVDPGRTRGTGHTRDPKRKRTYGDTFLNWFLMKTPQQAAQTVIYLAAAHELKDVSGRYFCNCAEVLPSEKALDLDLARELYKKSIELTQLSNGKNIRKETY